MAYFAGTTTLVRISTGAHEGDVTEFDQLAISMTSNMSIIGLIEGKDGELSVVEVEEIYCESIIADQCQFSFFKYPELK